jgi:cytidylate kinase
MSIVVAIDGPSGAGKGTLAKRLAAALDFAYLDTGLLYRATGMTCADPDDEASAVAAATALTPADLERGDLRTDTAAVKASKIAGIPDVRAALLQFQKDFAANPPDGKAGAILDGRDIGTVVCPGADVKLFVTASAEVRAERRTQELLDRGGTVVSIDNDAVLIDVGLKSEGRVPLKEFAAPGQTPEIARRHRRRVRRALRRQERRASNSAARRPAAKRRGRSWKAFNDSERVTGVIFGRSRAASPSICPAPWPSCRAARWTSARCATSRR